MCVCVRVNSQNSKKIQLDFNWILNFAPYVPFNISFSKDMNKIPGNKGVNERFGNPTNF